VYSDYCSSSLIARLSTVDCLKYFVSARVVSELASDGVYHIDDHLVNESVKNWSTRSTVAELMAYLPADRVIEMISSLALLFLVAIDKAAEKRSYS
jgi:hypothetical protein